MHLLSGCLFVIIFGVFIVVFSVILNILRVLFNLKKTAKNFKKKAENAYKPQDEPHTETHHQQYNRKSNNGKIFDKSEGEYVDFEEIKE